MNIAEILKDEPKGTKLYDYLHNKEVKFDNIISVNGETSIWCVRTKENNVVVHHGYSELGTLRGCEDGLQILMPSKEMRDWYKFAWKKGDVLVSGDKNLHIIFEGFNDDTYKSFKGKHYLWKEGDEEDYSKEEANMVTFLFEKANDESAQAYIKVIEKRLGGKLNLTSLEIEKTQPEFKDGDIVAVDLWRKNIRIFKEKENGNNICWGKYYIGISFNDDEKPIQTFENYKADCSSDRLATEEEKQLLFSALAKEGKAWDAEKKQIVDLKPKYSFKPFDKVIVRRKDNYNIWQVNIFSHIVEKGYYACIMGVWSDILPYNEDTAKLVGTTKSLEDIR